MVNIYPVEQASLAVPGSSSGSGTSPKPPKLRTKQNSVIGNILGPAFEPKPLKAESLDQPADPAIEIVAEE